MTNADQILYLLAERPGLDDDEISRQLHIRPRQQVNKICRQLVDRQLVVRKAGPSGKIGNFPVSATHVITSLRHSAHTVSTDLIAPTNTNGPPRIALSDTPMRETLIVIPCSGRKNPGGTLAAGCGPLTDDLPPSLAQRLSDARRMVLAKAAFDDRQLMPALQRYEGSLYVKARTALQSVIDAGLHVLIISGGYGIIKACEPIGDYSARLKLVAWPRGLLEEAILTYATSHRLKYVRAFVSRSTDYYRLISRIHWDAAGITAAIITPEPSSGAMRKAPRAQGEAITAFFAGNLHDDWRSSDGLCLHVSRAG